MRVLGLCGSLRTGSHNRRLLAAAAAQLPPWATFEVYDSLGDVPPYDEDADTPDAVQALRAAINAASAVLIATPEYNASVPGVLKNALDWASRPYPDNCLRDKPVAVIGASTGLFGAIWAQAELRTKVLPFIGARVIDEEFPVGQAHDAFTDEGELADLSLRERLTTIIDRLVQESRSGEQVA
ncbi:MAG: NADPH-dependent FMN reductase [Nocardioidaceae bacterium]